MWDLLIYYGFGLFVTLNPCVLPILPFVILSALNVSRMGPVALSAGLLAAYVLVGGSLALLLGEAVDVVSSTYVSYIGAALLIAMGLLFLFPQLYAQFTGFLGRFTTRANQAASDTRGTTLREQFFIGFLLAIAWVPCASPAIVGAGAATGADAPAWFVYLSYLFFGLGAVTFILILGLGARTALMARRNTIAGWINRIKPILGAVLVLIGLMILTGLDKRLETMLVGWGSWAAPVDGWLQDQQDALNQ